MVKKKLESTVHATARAEHSRNGGYGHITIYVYDLFGYGGTTLKMSCQTGGVDTGPKTSYAWKLGVCEGYDPLNVETLKKGYFLMAKIERRMKALEDEFGRTYTFAEYASRVLLAADIPVVHIFEPVNGQLPPGRNFTDLEALRPRADKDKIAEALLRMENALLNL